jgi:hypothetical protein
MTSSPLALADLHLDLLYERDSDGCIARRRNHDAPPPLVHLVRTAEGNCWLLSAAVAAPLRAGVHAALEALPVDFRDPEQPPLDIELLQPLLAGEGLEFSMERGPAFAFPEVMPSARDEAELLLDPHEVPTAPELGWLRLAQPHEHPLAVARNDRGEVVAVCHSSRSTPAAAEAGVETASAYRGRGLAGVVVSRWARAVRAEGRLPLYSTDWSNHASRAVARKLGLVMYGEDWRIFAAPT